MGFVFLLVVYLGNIAKLDQQHIFAVAKLTVTAKGLKNGLAISSWFGSSCLFRFLLILWRGDWFSLQLSSTEGVVSLHTWTEVASMSRRR